MLGEVWYPLLRADCRQKLLEARHRDAQFTLQPSVTVERQGTTRRSQEFRPAALAPL